ncbi:hypothetical protein Taro_035795 [Colocasia esculenta]|uniref:Uncharacterized protein n=1 Tax=Colocasia esculenta TaxID=4460 RepID=A0A843VVH2_COLES|nr:hypothetical protein [Colocasia esculenta]
MDSLENMDLLLKHGFDLVDHKISEEREDEQRLEFQRISSTDLFKAVHIKDEARMKNKIRAFLKIFEGVYIL